ncbi:hypothetical protein [Undibacterium griseum]|uniref:Uncharacterized protein n=1 Tax=Undibacterium griseum TaxID=2762295 RepID=A0ABR6YMB6_9BURK|nr:hypothetical protein [Undibacterium griseum]MBC3884953.1 hypothetical protein [Undibacterium griseum]
MGIIIECYELAADQVPSKPTGDVLLSILQGRSPVASLPLNSAIAAEALSVLENLDATFFAGALEPNFSTLIPLEIQADLHTKVDDVLNKGGSEDYVLAIFDLLEVTLSEAMRTSKTLVFRVR